MITVIRAVGDRMFMGIQNFDFSQIWSNFPNLCQICTNFAQI